MWKAGHLMVQVLLAQGPDQKLAIAVQGFDHSGTAAALYKGILTSILPAVKLSAQNPA